jgi:transcription antitermination protein NusB
VSARSKARKRALDVLYAADVRGVPGTEVLEQVRAERAAAHGVMNEYVADLVEGVAAHRERIDELLATYSQGWDLERMPVVDRNVLRIGVYELLWEREVPDAVVLDEAVSLARELSTDDSATFVNGLLGRIAQVKPSLPESRVDPAPQAEQS